MLQKDHNSCNLFKTQIYDDLIPGYLYYDTGNNLLSSYGESEQPLYKNNLSSMTNLIDSSVEEDVWTPAFIDASTTTTMPYLEGTANNKPLLGINEFFVISNPKFKNISTENNVKVGVDWLLNDVLNTDITPYKGVLFWYKKRGSRVDPAAIENIDIGQWIYSSSSFTIKTKQNKSIDIPAGQLCSKLNNKELQILPINKNDNTNSQIITEIELYDDILGTEGNIYEPAKIDLSTSSNKPNVWYIYDNLYYLKKDANYYSIHISEGDYFSYFDKNGDIDYFLSFNLMPIYRTIYNNLLNIITITDLSAEQSRRLKNLCFVLSTGPQNDKVTFNINGKYDNINYINDIELFLDHDDITTEHTKIKNICFHIYKELKILEKNKIYNTSLVPYKTKISHLNNNYSKVPNDIFHKLVSKYGLYLRFAGDNAKITINKLLKWKENNNSSDYVGGPNISIDARYIYWTSNRDIKNEAISIPTPGSVGHRYYDQHIQAGPMKIETDIDKQLVYFKSVDTGSEEATIKAGLIKPSQNPRIDTSESSYLLLPEIKYVMFYKQGAFKILSSTCYIDEPVGQQSMYNGKLDGKPIFLKLDKLSSRWTAGSNKEWNYNDTDTDDYKKPSIKFKLYNTTDVIKLDSLYINFLRYKEETLCACESFYHEIINRSENYTKDIGVNRILGIDVFEQTPKTVGYGRAGYCEMVYLGKIKSIIDNVEIEELSSSAVPGVSTRYAPPVLAYGGYDSSVVSELGIKLPNHPMPGEKLPILETRNPNYVDETKCYERTGFIQDSSYYSHSSDNSSSDNIIGTTVFEKGFFHPHKGWISSGDTFYDKFRDKTAVISYKPNKKSRFIFKGIGFIFDDTYTSYSSKVNILKGPEKTTKDEVNIQTGIRDVGSFFSKFSSEYICEECIPYRGKKDANGNFIDGKEKFADNDCGDNYQPKVDYYIYPLKDIWQDTTTNLVTSNDIDDIRIKDIEIKLNFINFDNIQDIKLTLKYTGTSTNDTRPASYYGMVSSDDNVFNETDVDQYLEDLADSNPQDTIILLNKEHIKQYGNDFVLKFSDYASPFVCPNPVQKTENGEINYSSLLNSSVSDGGVMHPSYKPDDYTDKQAQFYREILNTYNVCIINNKFRKWYGSKLCDSKFVLQVEVVNKYKKNNYGNIPDLHIKNNKDTNLLKSNVSRNSICNWEIIIDTYNKNDPEHRKKQKINISHPAADHIDYTRTSTDLNKTGSEYADGYNFIGDFTDKKFMVPPVNMNAPHQYLTDFNSCVYPDKTLNNFGFSRIEQNGLKYIYQAFNLFAMGIGAAAGMAAIGGLTGAFVGGTLFGAASSVAVSSIVNYFNSLRRARLVDSYDSSFYDPSYDDYGYGIADRALVEISDDKGYTWYTFDAKIFKYNKICSPIYKPLKVTYSGAGDSSKTTLSKLSSSIVPATPSETTSIIVDPSTFNIKESFIFTGNIIHNKELYIRKNIKLLDSKPNILNYSNVFIGNNVYNKDSTICIELPNVKPFYYLKNEILSISENIDIIYYDKNGYGYRNKSTITLNNINIINKDNVYNTYLLFNDTNLKKKLYEYPESKVVIQKSNAQDRLAVSLFSGGNYLTLASIKSLYSNIFIPEYTMPVYGEGSWGRGSSSIKLMPAKKIIFDQDYNLSDFSIGFSYNKYIGRTHIKGKNINKTINTNLLNIGLFDNVNGWPLYKNIEKYNINKILSDNIHYPYKNINDLYSLFYLYSTQDIPELKNSSIPYSGTITLLDHLVPSETTVEKQGLEGYKLEAIYTANQIDDISCYGGHLCNRAKFDVYINNVFLFMANLNNDGEGSAPDPVMENGLGSDPSDRYASHIITKEESDSILAVDPDNLNITYRPTVDNIDPHSGVTWIRLLNTDNVVVVSTCENSAGASAKILPYDDNKYWISIDKYQYGTFSRATTIKVLDKIEYICSEPKTIPNGLNCKNICGISRSYASSLGVGDSGVTWTPNITSPTEIMKIQAKSTAFDQTVAEPNSGATAIFTNTQADSHKSVIAAKYPDVKWEKIVFTRPDVRISCATSNGDTLMYIKEHYWIAKNKSVDGRLSIRADQILDKSNNILVRFKYNTRKLRHIDNFAKKYIVSPNGSVAYGGLVGTDEMPIKNSFYSWFCNYINRGTDTLSTVIPPYYMMLNEMIFRGFFGSSDGLEFKSSTLKTQYPHEWIPYEYDNAIQCNNSEFNDEVFIAGNHNLDQLGYRLRCWLLSKLVDSPYDKKKIVSRCLAYMKNNNGPGIVPDKKTFDILYQIKDPIIDQLRQTFMG